MQGLSAEETAAGAEALAAAFRSETSAWGGVREMCQDSVAAAADDPCGIACGAVVGALPGWCLPKAVANDQGATPVLRSIVGTLIAIKAPGGGW